MAGPPQALQDGLRARGAARELAVTGKISSSGASTVGWPGKDIAGGRARTHRDHRLGVGHLGIDAAQCFVRPFGNGPRDDQNVGVLGAGLAQRAHFLTS